MALTNVTNTTAAATQGNNQADKTNAQNEFTTKFLRDAQAVISNLGSSDKEIMDIIIRGTTSEHTNPGLLAGLQQLLDSRTRTSGMLTNFITKIGQTAEEIIRNIRN